MGHPGANLAWGLGGEPLRPARVCGAGPCGETARDPGEVHVLTSQVVKGTSFRSCLHSQTRAPDAPRRDSQLSLASNTPRIALGRPSWRELDWTGVTGLDWTRLDRLD